jgi:Uma2 family endonuclease
MTQPYNFTKSLPKLYTLEAYLEREAKAAHKSSYHNGNIIKMAGAKAKHNEICANALVALKTASKGLGTIHRTYTSDQKIYIAAEDTVVYSDALVVCREPEFWNEREDLIINPLLVVEVTPLSPPKGGKKIKSTRQHDRGPKFMLYKSIPCFSEYVLVEQDACKVEVWTKIGDNKWQFLIYTNLTDSIVLQSMENIKIAVSDIYENIIF